MAKRLYYLQVEDDSVKEYFIAIHTSLEAYKLAFYINQNTPILLTRSKKDVKSQKQEGVFFLFEWEDLLSDRRCQLI